jgi:chemotaxis protein MotA
MFVIVGIVLVFACVLGGYVAMGGKLGVLWQPFEVVIIVGAAIGALIVGNPKSVLSKIGKGFGKAMKGPAYKKHDYIEFLSIQYQVFKMARSKGMFTLESHVESPDESDLFNQLPGFHDNNHAVAFMCDYLRMMSLGSEFPHEMEALMDEEIETHHHENHRVASAIQSMSDALPALGIVAAALGVIKTMGSITEPPEVLGKLIGGALVGTSSACSSPTGSSGPSPRCWAQLNRACRSSCGRPAVRRTAKPTSRAAARLKTKILTRPQMFRTKSLKRNLRNAKKKFSQKPKPRSNRRSKNLPT